MMVEMNARLALMSALLLCGVAAGF